MTETSRSRHLAAPPDAVWATLADFGGIAAWATRIDHSSPMTDPADDVGAARRVQIGRSTLVERVVTWDPPSTLGYTLEGLPPVVRHVTNTWTIAAAATGSCVTLSSRIEPGPRPPHRLAARIVARKLGSASDELLADLAHHLEESP